MLQIRNASLKDLDVIYELEKACFDEDEAASYESLKNRLEVFPNHFWLLEDDGKLIAMVNGMVTNNDQLEDEMYTNASLHDEDGQWQMMFGVETLPQFRNQGNASLLMKEAVKDCLEDSRKGIILTCKEEHVPFYEHLGFKNMGQANSQYANKTWYLMRLDLE